MAKNPESPLEPFKRALVNATRSLAESPDLEIVYSGEGPQLSGNRAVLPHPPRDLTPIDAARIRGFSDQMALRIAHHDAAAHAKAQPLVNLFREEIEAKAGADLDRLTEAVQDQKAFARIARAIIRDLKMGDDMSDAPDQPDQDEDGGEEGEPEGSDDNDEGDGEGKSPQQSAMDENEATH